LLLQKNESGSAIRRPVEARDDVLVSSTPALAQDLEVTGSVRVDLFRQFFGRGHRLYR
jgi:predicted acyl esterase